MAYAGGIGQEIDQLKDLSVQELVRRQKLDPSLIYTIALQERQKMDAAGARQGVLDEPVNGNTVTSQMEQELAQQTMPQSPVNRVAPGVMQQGQRSMQQPQSQPQQRPQTARGISGVPANNMGAIGRARGGIIGYADGGDVSPTLYDEMGKQYLPGQPLPEGWQTLSNSPVGTQLPFNPADKEFADELREMERTRRENSTRTIPEFLSDFTFSRSNTAREALRSPLPALLQSLVDSGSMSNQEAVNELQKILSGPKGMGQRGRWNRENPNFASKLEAGKESREKVLEAQVDAFRARLKELNEAKAKAFPQEKAMFQQQIQDLLDNTPVAIRNAVGGAGMARGGVVGYRDGGEVDMEALLDALMMVESGGDPDAVGDAGEEGAFQIRPSTAADPGFGVPPMKGDRFDPEASREFARQYLQAMIDRYDGDVEAGLIAYNAGFGNADKFIAANRNYDVLPQAQTTQPYVRSIMGEVEKEGRRRDFRTGGGRSISTTAPESYTEKRRRERLGRQEAGLASLYPEVAMEEAEMYEPNLPDALTVMQAMESLRDGKEETPVIAGFPTREETDKAFTDAGLSGYGDGSRIRQRGRTGPEEEKLPQFDERSPQIASFPESPNAGIAGYLKNIGRQQQQRRDDFRRAVPGAEAAVARAEQEKEDGGIGYLRRLGRLQEGAAQRQAEEEKRAAQFMAMLQQNEDMIASMDPAADMPIQKFERGGSPNSYGGGGMGGLGEAVETATNWAMENPVDALAAGLMFVPGFGWGAAAGRAGIALTAKVAGPILKKYGTTAGQKIIQGIKTLGTKATTKPNPAAVPRVGNKPGQVTKGVVQPTQGVRGPGGRMQAGPPGRVIDPLRIAGGTGLAIKAGDALLGGEDEATEPTTQLEYFQELARKQKEAGTVEASRARRRAEEAAQRNQTPAKTGISGALDKTKPYLDKASGIAKILGRGAGASKGFEFSQIAQKSAAQDAEEAKMQLSRDQIAATTGQNKARAEATVNAQIVRAITAYTDPLNQQFIAAKTAKAAELTLEEGDPKVEAAVIKDFVAMLRNSMNMGGLGSVQGLGGGEGGGLSADQRANLQAFIAS